MACGFAARRCRRWKTQHWLLLSTISLAATPTAIHAAPFCIQSQALPPQCIYFDPQVCRKDADRQGGTCEVNGSEVRVSINVGQYCVVTSQLVSLCIYSDRGTCTAEAERQHAACTKAPFVAPSAAPDPYAAIGGR